MPSPVDQMRQILKALGPAFQMADQIQAFKLSAHAAIEVAEAVAALEARRRMLEESVQALGQQHVEALAANQADLATQRAEIERQIASARKEADQIIERTKREARDFIAQKEQDRTAVLATLVSAQRDLAQTREALRQLADDHRVAQASVAAEHGARRAAIEADLGPLEAKLAATRKEYRDLQERIAALAGR